MCIRDSFYHHAGWAQLAETEMKGYAPVGVIGQARGPAAREPVAREPAAREPASAAPACAQVIPWNFPLLMLAWKIAPAAVPVRDRRRRAGLGPL